MKKLILVLIGLVLCALSVSAVECGSVPTDGCVVTVDTTFTPGTYNLPNGISIGANDITLDCNSAKIFGGGSNSGIFMQSRSRNLIKNCVIQNFTRGIWMRLGSQNNSIINNTLLNTGITLHQNTTRYNVILSNSLEWIYSELSGNNQIKHNTIFNELGFVGSNENLITDNIFITPLEDMTSARPSITLAASLGNTVQNNIIQNRRYGIFLYSQQYYSEPHSKNNLIINNTIYNISVMGIQISNTSTNNTIILNNIYYASIIDSEESNNHYCISCIGNNYYDGATGPTCPATCTDDDGDGILNDLDLCSATPSGEPVNTNGCSCTQITIPFRDCPADQCEGENLVDYPDDGYDTLLACL